MGFDNSVIRRKRFSHLFEKGKVAFPLNVTPTGTFYTFYCELVKRRNINKAFKEVGNQSKLIWLRAKSNLGCGRAFCHFLSRHRTSCCWIDSRLRSYNSLCSFFFVAALKNALKIPWSSEATTVGAEQLSEREKLRGLQRRPVRLHCPWRLWRDVEERRQEARPVHCMHTYFSGNVFIGVAKGPWPPNF